MPWLKAQSVSLVLPSLTAFCINSVNHIFRTLHLYKISIILSLNDFSFYTCSWNSPSLFQNFITTYLDSLRLLKFSYFSLEFLSHESEILDLVTCCTTFFSTLSLTFVLYYSHVPFIFLFSSWLKITFSVLFDVYISTKCVFWSADLSIVMDNIC